jgi:hypothetical protein
MEQTGNADLGAIIQIIGIVAIIVIALLERRR